MCFSLSLSSQPACVCGTEETCNPKSPQQAQHHTTLFLARTKREREISQRKRAIRPTQRRVAQAAVEPQQSKAGSLPKYDHTWLLGSHLRLIGGAALVHTRISSSVSVSLTKHSFPPSSLNRRPRPKSLFCPSSHGSTEKKGFHIHSLVIRSAPPPKAAQRNGLAQVLL